MKSKYLPTSLEDGTPIDLDDFKAWLTEAERLGIRVTAVGGKKASWAPMKPLNALPSQDAMPSSGYYEVGVGLRIEGFTSFEVAKLFEFALYDNDEGQKISVHFQYS